MTARLRRGPRRCKPHSLSHRVAAFWSHRAAHVGTFKAHLLGKDWLREVVVVAIFLRLASKYKRAGGSRWRTLIEKIPIYKS